ncbi:LysM peptidoglycan-binding domain-containing protein [Sulfitobacter aestuariivivens]|uniref:LysM peptidoglycan-binding domain-containing protein n=1 Tax=Sulfitobacter aestuariivivens TaxID=2766981 RepID=A0A927D7E6_9RHOB|nr:LysM peptidoglycan-binding domain-containing protein [Sulfitobacter aestuariivivens]MBD3665766.1 LysM peptidoglycan-binding domain-containing protein [Sulfitobacter aestuariivivens]
MRPQRPVDPVTPIITFESYVIPGTVTTHEAGRTGSAVQTLKRIDPKIGLISGVALLVFGLGVLTAVLITPREVQTVPVADAPPAPPQTAATPVVLQQVVDASLAQTVARAQAPDILSPVPAQQPTHIDDLHAAILEDLTPKRTVGTLTDAERAERVRVAVDIVSRNKLRMLREGVLAGLYTVETRQDGDRRFIALRTVNAHLTSATMADLLRKAAEDGQIVVPPSLSRADGDVDMETMIFHLVHTSLANDGTIEGAEAARELSRRAFAASTAETRDVQGQRVYVVKAGDSLAYISLQFYGQPDAYEKIFHANRAILASPDLIKTGQRLIIPG